MNLSLEEVKAIRVALNKVAATTAGWEVIKKADAYLLENGLIYERTELPKVKYQKKAIVKYVFTEVK